MKKQLVGLVIMVMFLVGCTSMHDTSNLVIDEYVISIEEAKENAVKLAALSEFKTCFIRAALGSHIEKLPYEMIAALDKIDLLLVEIGEDYDFMTDCQKGQMSGLWTRLVVLGILEIIADINPAALTGLL
jgi:hypothetical protein